MIERAMMYYTLRVGSPMHMGTNHHTQQKMMMICKHSINLLVANHVLLANKCGRKCSKYPILFATFLTNLRAKLGRKQSKEK